MTFEAKAQEKGLHMLLDVEIEMGMQRALLERPLRHTGHLYDSFRI